MHCPTAAFTFDILLVSRSPPIRYPIIMKSSGVLTFILALILVQTSSADQYDPHHPSTVSSEAPEPLELEEKVLTALKTAWEEVKGTSCLAFVLILLPVTLAFLCCACLICICMKRSKSRSPRLDSTSSSAIGIKSRDGQLDPIPLTGLVNGHKSQVQIGFHPLRPVMGRPTLSR